MTGVNGMTIFRITYEKDGIEYVEEGRFIDTGSITAREWAEDYAYTLADKGDYKVEAIVNDQIR